jgi:uncharacterized membrane protein YdcZ (DUF606 family)
MVLVANMIASKGSGPAIVNFDLFASLFGIVSLVYLTLATFNENLGFPPVLLGLDIANTLWTFIGGVATAAIISRNSCTNSVSNCN